MMVDTCLRPACMRMVVALLFVFSGLLSWIPVVISADVVISRVGGVARLNCSSTNGDSVEWKRILPKESPITLGFIYVDSYLLGTYEGSGRHNVSLDPQTGAYDLVITNVTESDAGKYICTETLEKREIPVELVVLLVYDPTCSTNINLTNVMVDNDCDIDPDYIEFNCSIAYRGNVAPDMQLQMSSIGVLDNVTVRNWTQSTTKYMSVVWASNASWHMSGRQFRCEVTNAIVGTQPSCSSTPVSVIYFYKTNITVEIINNEEYKDCAANTNTSEHCSFSWRGTYRDSSKSSDHLEVLGSTIDLKSRDVELSSMRCRAECIIRNKSCVSETMFIRFLSGGDSSSKTYILPVALFAGAVILVSIAAVVSLVCYCYRTRRKSKPRSYDNYDLENCDPSDIRKSKPRSYDNYDLENCDPSDIVNSFKKVLRENKELKNYIDPENGLLSLLGKLGILIDSEITYLEKEPSYQSCNEKLLDIINSKLGSDNIKPFIKALGENEQDHIAKFIVAAGRETPSFERLLSREERKHIDDNMFCLEKLIDTNKLNLLGELVLEKCITSRHKNRVDDDEVNSTPELKASALFTILQRRRYKDFRGFIACLRRTRQDNIAEILEMGGVAEIKVKLREQSDWRTIEAELRRKLTGLVDRDNEIELSEDQKTMIERLLAELKENDIYFIGTCPRRSNTRSISVFLQVRTGDPSAVMTNVCNSGSLKKLLKEMFQELLNNRSLPVEGVSKKKCSIRHGQGPRNETFACEPSVSFRATKIDDFNDRSIGGCVTGMKIYPCIFNGNITVIGGIETTYSGGTSALHGSADPKIKPHVFTLGSQEKIVSAEVRSGFLLDALTFTTNTEKKLGPYGGTGGSVYTVNPPNGAFLGYLKGTVEKIESTVEEIEGRQTIQTIRHFKLVWEKT